MLLLTREKERAEKEEKKTKKTVTCPTFKGVQGVEIQNNRIPLLKLDLELLKLRIIRN